MDNNRRRIFTDPVDSLPSKTKHTKSVNHFSSVFKGKRLVGLKRSPTRSSKTIIKCLLFRKIKITMIRKEVPLWKCQVKRSMPFFTKVSPSSVERKPAILNTGRNGIFAVENPTKNYTSQLTSLWITRARSTFENDRFQVRLYFCECNEFSIFSHQVHIFQIFRSTEHQDFNWQLTYVASKLRIYSVCLRQTIFDNINKPNKNTAAEENSCLYPGS